MTKTARPTEITLPNGQVLRDGGLFKSKGSKVARRFTLRTHEHDYGSSFSTDEQTGEVTRVQGISLVSMESNWVRADRVVVVAEEAPVAAETKACSHCKEQKELSEYNVNKRAKDGRHAICRECNKAKTKARRAAR